jgi:hypothetical protein
MSAITMGRYQEKELRAAERDQQRGYSINYKQVTLAFAIEIIIVITSLIGAWLMASKYGRTSTDHLLMMLAPVAYAMVECSRVPLALAARTQRSFLMKFVAVLAVLCAAGVTIKSMSMLGEIMFRPRLEAVSEAKRHLDTVNHDRESIVFTIKAADAVVAQRKSEREAAEQQVSRIAAEMGKRPGHFCSNISGTNKYGNEYNLQKCTDDPAVLALKQQLQSANEYRTQASQKLEEANAERNALSPTDANKRSTDAEASYREALFHSQLHSFTAMVFGKDPNQVTEGEIASFLRVFVFLPAIMVALASTLLAMTAVHRIRPKKETIPVAVPDEAVIQILKAAVQSASMQLDSATTAATKTFGASQDVGHKTTPAADSSLAKGEPPPIKPTKKSGSEAIENVDADVVQLRPQRGAI